MKTCDICGFSASQVILNDKGDIINNVCVSCLENMLQIYNLRAELGKPISLSQAAEILKKMLL